MLSRIAIALLLSAAPARAEDWLLSAVRAAAAAPIPGEAVPEKAKSDWVPYEPASRQFRADLPSSGWTAFEEDDALGSVVRVLGPDDSSGALRAALTVRLVDRDSPVFVPAKDAVESMRRQGPGRESTAVQLMRVGAGLARLFEITETRRVPGDTAPSAPMTLHQYVAVIPRGEAYFVIRLVTARENYLDFRGDFVHFLKTLKPVGAR
ncbi:MAG: hypothetical protein ACHQ49_15375 [Elusimicrobiota bacterium]